jgi:hypothetical protein
MPAIDAMEARNPGTIERLMSREALAKENARYAEADVILSAVELLKKRKEEEKEE